MATKKQIRKALKSDTPLNAMYRLIPEKKRACIACFAQLLGYDRADIQKVLKAELKTKAK